MMTSADVVTHGHLYIACAGDGDLAAWMERTAAWSFGWGRLEARDPIERCGSVAGVEAR